MTLDLDNPVVDEGAEGSTLEASEATTDSEGGDQSQSQAQTAESNEQQEKVARGSKLQKLIDSKYGGDEDKFADALYEQWNSSSRTHSAIEELKQLINTSTQRQPEPEPLDKNPDIQWLNEQIGTLDAELEASEEERQGLVAEYNALKTELAVMKATQADARDIRATTQRLSELERNYKKTQISDKRIQREKSNYNRQLKQAEVYYSSARDKQIQQQKRDVAEVESLRTNYHTTVASVINNSNLSQEDKEDLYDMVKLKVGIYIEKNGPVDDMASLGRSIAEKYLKLQNQAQFREVSQQKAQAAGKAPAAKPNQQPTSQRPQAKLDGKLSFKEALARTEAFAKGR